MKNNNNDETEIDHARLGLCLVNVSAILFVAGIVDNFKDGVKLGFKSVKSGEAIKKLHEFAKCSKDINIS